VIVLLGAVVAAYLPSLLAGVARRPDAAGWRFRLGLEALQALAQARQAGQGGLATEQLAVQLRVDALQLDAILQKLKAVDWVGELGDSASSQAAPRWVLLVDWAKADAAPVVDQLLVNDAHAAAFINQNRTCPEWILAFKL
jgi:membrane protein